MPITPPALPCIQTDLLRKGSDPAAGSPVGARAGEARVGGMGRLFAPDIRDLRYAARSVLGAPAAKGSKYWGSRSALDQGMSSQCVGYSAWALLDHGPVRHRYFLRTLTPSGIYAEAQKVDEWDGEEYEGTSVRAAMKVLQAAGAIATYRWAWDNATVAGWILRKGPVVFGTVWPEEYFELGKGNFLTGAANGNFAGGHAYLLWGINTSKACPDGTVGAYRIMNSWGEAWGDKGRAWLPFSEAELLLGQQGEAAMATEVDD
jgi:hypothetical protein